MPPTISPVFMTSKASPSLQQSDSKRLCLVPRRRVLDSIPLRFVKSQSLDNASWTSSFLNMLIPGCQQGRSFTVTLGLPIRRSSKAVPSLQLGSQRSCTGGLRDISSGRRGSCGSSVCTTSFAVITDHVDDGGDNEGKLHYSDQHVDDPDGPARETEADDHIDAEDPCVLQITS